MRSFYNTVTDAINDIVEHGYDSQARLDEWIIKLRQAAIGGLVPQAELDKQLRNVLISAYTRLVDKRQVMKVAPGVRSFTIERLKPRLRAELDRRMMMSANLIKLNRQQAIDKTLQRFSGWASSIPAGGTKAVDRQETKDAIRKSLGSLPFEERRVIIDQGHKLSAAISEIVAVDGGAIAAVWHSHWHQPGYNYREDHKERDGHVYALRGTWAYQQGLAKPGDSGYFDDITRPGEEVFCRCSARYVFLLKNLPDDMLTRKGQEAVNKIKNIGAQV